MVALADTQVMLWFVWGDSRLSSRHRRAIEQSDLLVSIVSLWEIAIKVNIGKLDLGMSYPDFVRDHISDTDVDVIDIGVSDLFEYMTLPLLHRDPFDRLLIAQASARNIPVITTDQAFSRYDIETVS